MLCCGEHVIKETMKMGFSTSTCTEFVEVLASKAPVPGGGGASALVGAVGTALGNMVGSLPCTESQMP